MPLHQPSLSQIGYVVKGFLSWGFGSDAGYVHTERWEWEYYAPWVRVSSVERFARRQWRLFGWRLLFTDKNGG